MMARPRRLIVNADDFGQSAGINRGIIQAHERGIVTSASLMVRWPAATEAASYAREHPALSVGLHLDLGEWTYVRGSWVALYEVVRTGDPGDVEEEAGRQLTAFRRLIGGEPTHIDSHQHVHRTAPVRHVLSRVARTLGVPLRHCTPGVRHCGAFYGQTRIGEPHPDGISLDRLLTLIRSVPVGVTELACHPGYADDAQTGYRAERAAEVRTLCDPYVRLALGWERIQLCCFREATRSASAEALDSEN